MLNVQLKIRGIGETLDVEFECDEVVLAKPRSMGLGLIFVNKNLSTKEDNRFVRLTTIKELTIYPILQET